MKIITKLLCFLFALATPCLYGQTPVYPQINGKPVTNTYGCLDGYDHLPCTVFSTVVTGQTAAVTTQTAVASALAGQYSFRCVDIVTIVATTSTLPGCQIGATDPTTNATVTQGGAAGSSSNAVGASTINTGYLDVKATAGITYSLPGYVSNAAATMTYKYAVEIVREH